MTISDEVMTLSELDRFCRSLAGRYRNQQEWDDLFSVGYLEGLSSIREGVPKNHVYINIRRTVSAYYNIKNKPMSVPITGASTKAVSALARGTAPEGVTGVQRALYEALVGTTDKIRPNTMGFQDSAEDSYIKEQTLRRLLKEIPKALNKREAYVIMQVLKGYTKTEIGKGMPRSTAERVYKSAVDKLESLCAKW